MTIEVKCKSADRLPIDRLLEFQGDLKKLTKQNRDRLQKSIERHGFIAPIFVWENKGDYMLLDGHQRLATLLYMRKKGFDMPMIPVDYIEADNEKDARDKLLHITSQYGEFNVEELEEWISELDDIDDSLRFADGELEINFNNGEEEETIGDDEIPDDVEPVTKLGDLWELGRHRLLCGDSTKEEDVKTLCNDMMIDSWVTDPPYNVAYEGKTKEALTIENDSMDDDSFRVFLRDAFIAATSVMKPGAAFYIWHSDLEGFNFRGACRDADLQVRQCLIWHKNSMVMGRQDYHWQHEPCLYGWKNGAGHLWNSDRKQTTVLNFDRPTSSQDHPTMKPVPLFQYCVENNTKEMDIVLDTFAGSGTTLVVCEKTNRIARLMELDPHYCDVIVNRYKTWCTDNDLEYTIKLNGEELDG